MTYLEDIDVDTDRFTCRGGITELAERFEHWRQSRTHGRERIPEDLWDQAVALSTVLSNARVAKRLRLSPTDLRKQRVARQGPSAIAGAETPPAFVDITPSMPWPTTAPPSNSYCTMAKAIGFALNVFHKAGSTGGLTPRPRPGACPPVSCAFCSGMAIPRLPIWLRTGAGSLKPAPTGRYNSRAARRRDCERLR